MRRARRARRALSGVRHRFSAALTGLLLLGAALGTGAPPAAGLEPTTAGSAYGDFETTGLTPQGWSVVATSPSRAVVSTSRAISGTRSLLVEDTSTGSSVSASRPAFAVTSGQAYHVQGYSYATSGTQSLSITFLSSSGAVVGTARSASSGAVMVWTRVEAHAVAPADARTATIEVTTDVGSTSQGWWDAVEVIRPWIDNAGFEAVPTSTAPVPGWAVTASGGATATTSTTAARTGSRSLRLADSSATGAVSAASSLSPVFASVGHDVRVWVRPERGSFTLTVRWYDGARALVGSKSLAVSKPVGVWSLVVLQSTAPSKAHWGSVQLSTSAAGVAAGLFDVASVAPTAGAPVTPHSSVSHGDPVRGFSNTNLVLPLVVEGRAKLATIVSGLPAELQIADIATGTVEVRRALAGMDVGWGLAKGSDGSVYAAGSGGHLFRFDAAAGTVRDLGRVTPRATTIFDLETGPDGRIWGVSYPGSELWAWNPATATTSNLGTVSIEHDYARSLAVDRSYAYVGVGSGDPAVIRVSLASPSSKLRIDLPAPVTSGNISEMELLGRFLQVRTPSGRTVSGASYTSERRLYDLSLHTWEVPANMAAQTPSGVDSSGNFYYLSYKQLWAVDAATGVKVPVAGTTLVAGRERHILRGGLSWGSGEWLLAYDPVGAVRLLDLTTFAETDLTLAFLPTSMRIKTLDEGPNGTLLVGGFGGASLAVVSTTTDDRAQYPMQAPATGSIGEMEGAVSSASSVAYLGTYTEARIFRYDASQPWVDGTNPKPLASLGATYRQDRPIAWARSGTRTYFGTIPKYGVLGGVLGFLADDSGPPTVVASPVPEQSIVSLAASGTVVYGGTSRWGGLGATPTQPVAKLFAYDTATRRTLWTAAPMADAQAFGAVAIAPNGSLWAASGPMLYELDPRTGSVLRRVMVYPAPYKVEPTFRNADLVITGGLIHLAAMDRIYTVDPATLRVEAIVPSGVTAQRLALVGDRLYYPSGATLRSVNR